MSYPSASDVSALVYKSQLAEAINLVLAPEAHAEAYAADSEAVYAAVFPLFTAKDADIAPAVASIEDIEVLDLLMKYCYKVMGRVSANDDATEKASQKALAFHAALVNAAGLGSITRAVCDKEFA